jgi:hypothetical protein
MASIGLSCQKLLDSLTEQAELALLLDGTCTIPAVSRMRSRATPDSLRIHQVDSNGIPSVAAPPTTSMGLQAA